MQELLLFSTINFRSIKMIMYELYEYVSTGLKKQAGKFTSTVENEMRSYYRKLY